MAEKLVSPGIAPTINLAGDCAVLLVAAVLSTLTPDRGLALGAALSVAAPAVAVWLIACRVLHHYRAGKDQGLIEDLALTSVVLVAVTMVVALPHLLLPAYAPPMNEGLFLAVTWGGILWLRASIPGLRAAADTPLDVLILGTGPLARHTGAQIRHEKSRRRVLGYLAFPGEPVDPRLDAPVLGGVGDLERILAERALDEVYLAEHAVAHGEAMQQAIHTLEQLGTPFAIPAAPFRFDRARPVHLHAIHDGYLHYLNVERKPGQRVLKRVFDIVASSLILAALAPLFLVVALLIKLTSQGPVLFKQARVGEHGRPFHMLKFRSMVKNAEALKAGLLAQNERTGPVFKMVHDPRITPIGRVIRKYSIDELPQFLNVLRGEMTIVGPRPPLPDEVAKYEAWQRRRLSVMPGITCAFQVTGRDHPSFEEWMYLDMQYIDHWSLLGDIKLILKTIPAVLSGRGAS
ncbi:MAG: sugar transferase [Byssovorax sp.]